MDFPRNVYKSAANCMSVPDEAARQAALKAGWFDSVPEALAGKANAPAPTAAPVVVFKKTGAKVDRYTAKDQAEADALIAGDGWHLSEAAAIAAAWPAPDAVPGIITGLSEQSAEAVAEYATGLGLKVAKGEKAAALLARIETALLTGPAAGK